MKLFLKQKQYLSDSDDFYLSKKPGKAITTATFTATTKTTINGPTSKGKAIYQISSSSSTDDLNYNKILNQSKKITSKASNTSSTTAATKKKISISSSSSTDDLLKANQNIASKKS